MDIRKRVFNVIQENIEDEHEIRMQSDLEKDLGIDSLSMVMIINGLEQEFSLNIETADYTDIRIVSDIVEQITQAIPEVERKTKT